LSAGGVNKGVGSAVKNAWKWPVVNARGRREQVVCWRYLDAPDMSDDEWEDICDKEAGPIPGMNRERRSAS
jgi:hypothetical protein